MGMGKKMILTIFIVAVALGTEAEFQFRIRLLRSAAHRTAMSAWHLLHRLLVSRPSVHLGRRNSLSHKAEEKDHKIEKRHGNRNLRPDRADDHLIYK